MSWFSGMLEKCSGCSRNSYFTYELKLEAAVDDATKADAHPTTGSLCNQYLIKLHLYK